MLFPPASEVEVLEAATERGAATPAGVLQWAGETPVGIFIFASG